jgi:hypothetical protein
VSGRALLLVAAACSAGRALLADRRPSRDGWLLLALSCLCVAAVAP